MSIQYRIAIDRDHDGNFQEVNEDLSARVLELRWRLGMGEAYDSLADVGRAEITLLNRDGAFSPERQPLQIGARLRIQSMDGGAPRTHFVGFLSHIDVEGGDWGERRAIIHLHDVQPWLEANSVRLAPLADVTADAAIAALLDAAIVRRAIIGGFCLIDLPGYNLIDSVRVFPAQNLSRRLAPGKTRFAHVGDWWREDTSIRRAIGELAASERGRFYIDRDGAAVFLNRHYTLVTKTLAARFTDNMTGIAYRYGAQRVNRLLLKMTPREIGQRRSLLWQLSGSLRIAPETQLMLNLPLLDERGEPLGLLELEELQAAFHRRADGGGPAITAAVDAEVVELGFTSLQVRLSNRNARAVYLTALNLLGLPLYRRHPLEILLEDEPGIHLHGLQQLSLDLPALSDFETAAAFASYELQRRKHPAGVISELRLEARDHRRVALELELFDRIRISETQTGQRERDYFIVGEAHHVREGGAAHDVAFTLEPADLTQFVIINHSRVDAADEVITPY